MNREQIKKWAREADVLSHGPDTPYFPDHAAWVLYRDEQLAHIVLIAAKEACVDLRFAQTINNQEYPPAWHDGVDAAIDAIDALKEKCNEP